MSAEWSEPPDIDAGGRAGSTVLRMMVGARLRRYREAAGITPDRAGYVIRGSVSKISRVENGRVGFKLRDVEDLLTLYGVTRDAARREMLALAERASAAPWWSPYGDIVPDWLQPYLGMEAAASVIRSFETQFVHGLFQTEDYARAVTMLGAKVASQAEIGRRVDLRMTRQDLFVKQPDPPQIWVVIDEAVLRRPVGGRDVMIGQLKKLIEVAGLPHITVQAVPFSRGGHAAAGGAFTLLRFDEPDIPDTVFLEQLTTALYLNKRADIEHYLEVMNSLSAQALNSASTVRFLRKVIKET